MSKPYRVVITDSNFATDEPEREILEEIAEVVRCQCKTEDEVIEAGRDADGLLVQWAPITKKVIDVLDRVKVVSRYGIGVDNIDIPAATEKGIYICNVIYTIDDVADHALSLMLALNRKIVDAALSTRAGSWDWKKFVPVLRMKDSCFGIVGLGKVGRTLAERLKGFGGRILGYDPYLTDEAFKELGVEKADLETLLRQADFVSIHTPLTDETRHLINEKTLKMMKPTAYLINTARGPIVDEKALSKALEEGWIAGAGLDVLEEEPVKPDNPLIKYKNVIITPHMAFYSESVLSEIQRKCAENVRAVLKGEVPKYLLNKEVLEK